ncbi:hypothetical protein NDU88_004301 [Pleurodeles waltl]|uniref:Uncharacterized protein n=1 Tax=Pleurodeles waltl TaxID=8319 RepID=A0AAV7M9P3_PLEWA|nr:hypothetical protein NDU88_004301 [Pleurodeles waltl]
MHRGGLRPHAEQHPPVPAQLGPTRGERKSGSEPLRESSTTFESPVPASEVHPITPPSNMVDQMQGATMDRILQEISAVGHRLEGMDNAMTLLTAEMKSMSLDIAGFQSRVMGLEQRVLTVETHITSSLDRDQ